MLEVDGTTDKSLIRTHILSNRLQLNDSHVTTLYVLGLAVILF